MSGAEIKEPRRCIRCSAEPKLVGTMLDSNKGRTIRIFVIAAMKRSSSLISAPARRGESALAGVQVDKGNSDTGLLLPS